MTEDQKAMSLLLDLLHAAKGVPVAHTRLSADVKYCGYRNDITAILDLMEEKKLIARFPDSLGIRRYTLTAKGKEALDAL
jgi:hypothetical protein